MEPGSRFSALFQRLLDAPEQALAEIQTDPAGFEEQVLAQDRAAQAQHVGLFQMGAVGFLLFAADGARLPLEAPTWVLVLIWPHPAWRMRKFATWSTGG